MALRIEGKPVAQKVRQEVARGVEDFKAKHGRAPGLHVVLAGDDEASAVYVRNKEKAAKEVGMAGEVHRLPNSVSLSDLLGLVATLNANPAVDGILVQLPLPGGLDENTVIEHIDPQKDVDGLHASSVGALWRGRRALVPCTPLGCMRLMKEAGIELSGARAVVIGRSNLVGKPIAALLLAANATVTLAHSRTRNLKELCREADVLVVAIGRPRFVQGDWVRPGATVIDVGINREASGKLCGDVDFESAEPVAGAITPVPGGVGPMTIAMLLENTLTAARRRLGENA